MTDEHPSISTILELLKNNRLRIFGLLFFIMIIFTLLLLTNTPSSIPDPVQEINQTSYQEELPPPINNIEIGKIIQQTVQSDPCIEDIVQGLPTEAWRCSTPVPSQSQSELSNNIDQINNNELNIQPPTTATQVRENSIQTEDQVYTETINWADAFDYVGELVILCGPVVDSYFAASSNGQPTFLNIGREYPDPDRFTALIWGRNLESFPFNPDVYYLGKTVCIKGVIEEYEGILEIEVRRPDQIEVK
jgi:hypothetical protein